MSVVDTAHSVLQSLTVLLVPATGGLAAALAVVVLTVAVRLLISPLTYAQVRGERRRAALAPRVAELRERHRDDPLALAGATSALYRESGAGLLRGLLPALVQAPFFLLMYRVAVTDPAGALLGVPLTAHLIAGWPVFVVLLALAGALAWWSSRRARRNPESPRWMAAVPFLTLATVAWLPLAGALYVVTSTAWTALETLVWRRGG